jgi:hypothetical protein
LYWQFEVAVTVPELVEAPVENPAVKVPLNLPKLAATGLARVKAAAVAPEAMLEKAAATSLAVMLTLAVKVRPLTVTKSLGLSALNVTTLSQFSCSHLECNSLQLLNASTWSLLTT